MGRNTAWFGNAGCGCRVLQRGWSTFPWATVSFPLFAAVPVCKSPAQEVAAQQDCCPQALVPCPCCQSSSPPSTAPKSSCFYSSKGLVLPPSAWAAPTMLDPFTSAHQGLQVRRIFTAFWGNKSFEMPGTGTRAAGQVADGYRRAVHEVLENTASFKQIRVPFLQHGNGRGKHTDGNRIIQPLNALLL